MGAKLEAAIASVEKAAAGETVDIRESVEKATQVVEGAISAGASAKAVAKAALSAVLTAQASTHNAQAAKDAAATLRAADEAAASLPQNAHDALRIIIRKVFDRLREAAARESWTDETAVRPEFFGPLWPDGVPEGLPRNEEYDTLLNRLTRQELPTPAPPQPTFLGNLEIFSSLGEAIRSAHEPIISRFQEYLRTLEGRSFGYEENQRICEAINDTLDQLRVALCCPKKGCGLPSRLRCRKPGRSVSGIIHYEHYTPLGEGRTEQDRHEGSAGFQRLTLLWADGCPVKEIPTQVSGDTAPP